MNPRVNHPDDIQVIQQELDFILPSEHKVLGYHTDKGFMIAALTKYTLNSDVEVSGMAKGKWFHPDIYADLFNYIFKTLRCKRASFIVEKDNHKCIQLLEKGGCVRECELRGIDRYLYSMLPVDYYGKKSK